MQTPNYFERFFEEKDIDHDEPIELTTSDGTWHHMTYGVVIEAIKQTRGLEADRIAGMLRRIDFANGDVRDYLRHLGMALASMRA